MILKGYLVVLQGCGKDAKGSRKTVKTTGVRSRFCVPHGISAIKKHRVGQSFLILALRWGHHERRLQPGLRGCSGFGGQP